MPTWTPDLSQRFVCLVLGILAAAVAGGVHALPIDAPAPAAAPKAPAPGAGRGELLYATHCKACHSEQVHWRDRKAATDWPRLKAEVQRWQAAARLGWREPDVVAVARYLNETVYHLPQTDDGLGGLPPGERGVHVAGAAP